MITPAESAAADSVTSATTGGGSSAKTRHLTLVDHFLGQLRDRADAPALYFRAAGRYRSISWGDFGVASRRLAAYLVKEGVAPQEHVAIWSNNRPEWHIADMGILMLRCRPVPVYLTLSAEQGGYVLGHSETKVAIVENPAILERLLEVRKSLPALRRVIVIEGLEAPSEDGFAVPWGDALGDGEKELQKSSVGAEIDERSASVGFGDIATLIYTSGTTGPPKAVTLTHENIAAVADALLTFLDSGPDERVLSYLPLAHVAERIVSEFRSYMFGNPTWFLDGIPNLGERLKEVKPTLFFGVPRIWEKMAQTIKNRVDEAPVHRRALARWALKTGGRVYEAERDGKPVDGMLARQHKFADKLVLSKLRAALGFDQARILVCGAAPISPDVLVFFRSFGLEVCEGYGQTEGSALTTLNRPGLSRVGTVGTRLPGIEVEIAADGEILVRGANVFAGYYKEDAATAETLIDGWLHTGDVGEFDADGYLRITDRKKDLIITAGGKNIAPSNIEGALKQHPLIANAVAIGDRRPFVSALLTLDPEETARFAKQNNLGEDLSVVAGSSAVKDAIAAHIAVVNKNLSQVEQVKTWKLLGKDFTMGDELTPTLKVKRKVVAEKYAAEIEALYTKS